ncbi:Transposon Ty3-G Gag-Pol polyprotein like [Argiope bruennichi]|uniref:Transposon Ty3-G Gag-Pol polyprotein like n=1 Tax=Argiope bruennichi TaxID=94029 RepID=A0A8T0ECM5_ARGBR|nr:Transposon Ty3-G Gag-Pol polyprotein like [Argiope bruennichi]
MAEVLKGCKEYAVPYLDDIAIYSHSWDSHLKHLETVLKRIEAANLTLKPFKCKFAQDHFLYLGHTVGQGSRRPSETKVQTIVDFVTSKTKTDIRAFLGLPGKTELVSLGQDLDLEVHDKLKVVTSRKMIMEMEDYDEDYVRSLAENMVKKREMEEKEREFKRKREYDSCRTTSTTT